MTRLRFLWVCGSKGTHRILEPKARSKPGRGPVAWQASAGRMPVAKLETENPCSRKWKLKIQPGGVSVVS